MGEGRRRAAAVESLLAQARALHEANRLAEAKDLYRQVLQLAPGRAQAWLGLGTLAQQVGLAPAALEALERAAGLAPDDPEARLRYAQCLQEASRFEEAVEQLAAACRLRPDDARAWEALGIAQQSLGDTDAAGRSYEQALALAPSPGTRIKRATLVSPIIRSRAALLAERRRLEAGLESLLADASLRFDDPMRAALWSNFYLAFQGADDRPLQTRFAQLYRQACPSLEHVAAHCRAPGRRAGRLRVGLVSRFLHNHSIGRTSRGFFAQLAREAFEVCAIFVAPTVEDEFARSIREGAERSLVVPQDLAEARRLVGELELDVLFYQDIGMEPFTYFLAFSRLAPVQCVSFGHPDTTGIPTIDYFVSSDLFEPPDAAGHYSERLFLLHDLGTLAYYYRPVLAGPPPDRAAFGLRRDENVYLCPQNLFKFHPDMDELIAGVLRRDPRGRVVAIAGRVARWTDLLRARWRETMPDVADRVTFLPRQTSRDYLHLIALADVMLDTVHFNGMNTSLEAFAVGTPVVTLPGAFQRGRHTQGMYRKMGIASCVAKDASDYADIAVRLAQDGEFGAAVRREIAERSGVLFEDARVIREFERFFREACGRTGATAN